VLGISIVIPKLSNQRGIDLDFVDHAMFIGYPSGPIACKGVLEPLRFADPPSPTHGFMVYF
jgi:hypothetical protein